MKAYTLKKDGDTDELHLFEGDMKDKGCTSAPKSICKKMDRGENAANIFACYDENKARIECAVMGRAVCGVCVSHLYESY
ncbi:hypothetical protein [Undibacterium sp.]|uniref:hypothetical protein n=1 Tax=Undibacterium sp. TaxID=1914977 RepID=UPI0027313E94|nr:hypothetical protein [Undibacterium sp.]MDP1978290.1 hypothetical protein [Undibacterium sp.]